MNLRQLISSLALGLACCASSGAQGALLFSRSLLIDRSANIFTTENFNLKVDFSDTFITPVTNTLFSDSVVTPGSAGQILKIEPNDAGFAEIAKLFNDGVNQAMRFVMTEKSSGRAEGRGYMQAPLFSKPTTAPDFAPKFIDKIELVINQFTLCFRSPVEPNPRRRASRLNSHSR